jgi:hypothetical protein
MRRSDPVYFFDRNLVFEKRINISRKRGSLDMWTSPFHRKSIFATGSESLYCNRVVAGGPWGSHTESGRSKHCLGDMDGF